MGNLFPRDSFKPLFALRDRINELLADFFNNNFLGLDGISAEIFLDLAEKDQEFVIKANLPGVSTRDLDVQLDETSITIKGTYTEETQVEDSNYLIRERRKGAFMRTLPFPAPVIPEEAKASFHNGVLEITVPKQKGANKRFRVDITGSSGE